LSEHSLITPSRLLILYDVSQKINSLLNLKKLLHEIMVQAVKILHAEKGANAAPVNMAEEILRKVRFFIVKQDLSGNSNKRCSFIQSLFTLTSLNLR